jgi:hypothetical protein
MTVQKNLASLVVVTALVVGAFAINAVAEGRGRTLEERVSALEESADRQRRAIDNLREENEDQ